MIHNGRHADGGHRLHVGTRAGRGLAEPPHPDGGRLPGRGPAPAGPRAGLHTARHLDRIRQPVRRGRTRLPLRVRRAVAVGRGVDRHRARLLHRAACAPHRPVHRSRHSGVALRAGGAAARDADHRAGLRDHRCLPVPRRRPAAGARGGSRSGHRGADHGGLLHPVHVARRHAVDRLPRRRQRSRDDRRRDVRRRVPHRRRGRADCLACGARAAPGIAVRRHGRTGGVRPVPADDVPAARRSEHVPEVLLGARRAGRHVWPWAAGSSARSWSRP